jgi:hypothetical protein
MPTNSKDTKGLGKAIIDAVGFLSFLFGSLILLAIVFGAIGSIFMSTKRLFPLSRVKKDDDNSIASRKVEESKTTCPKGIFTEDEFLKMVKVVDRESKEKRKA